MAAGAWVAGLCQSRDDVRIWAGFYESSLGVGFVFTSHKADTCAALLKSGSATILVKHKPNEGVFLAWSTRRRPLRSSLDMRERRSWDDWSCWRSSGQTSIAKTLIIENIHLVGSNSFHSIFKNKTESPWNGLKWKSVFKGRPVEEHCSWAPQGWSCNTNLTLLLWLNCQKSKVLKSTSLKSASSIKRRFSFSYWSLMAASLSWRLSFGLGDTLRALRELVMSCRERLTSERHSESNPLSCARQSTVVHK